MRAVTTSGAPGRRRTARSRRRGLRSTRRCRPRRRPGPGPGARARRCRCGRRSAATSPRRSRRRARRADPRPHRRDRDSGGAGSVPSNRSPMPSSTSAAAVPIGPRAFTTAWTCASAVPAYCAARSTAICCRRSRSCVERGDPVQRLRRERRELARVEPDGLQQLGQRHDAEQLGLDPGEEVGRSAVPFAVLSMFPPIGPRIRDRPVSERFGVTKPPERSLCPLKSSFVAFVISRNTSACGSKPFFGVVVRVRDLRRRVVAGQRVHRRHDHLGRLQHGRPNACRPAASEP